MTFDDNKGENKIILAGDEKTVYSVLAEYHAESRICRASAFCAK